MRGRLNRDVRLSGGLVLATGTAVEIISCWFSPDSARIVHVRLPDGSYAGFGADAIDPIPAPEPATDA